MPSCPFLRSCLCYDVSMSAIVRNEISGLSRNQKRAVRFSGVVALWTLLVGLVFPFEIWKSDLPFQMFAWFVIISTTLLMVTSLTYVMYFGVTFPDRDLFPIMHGPYGVLLLGLPPFLFTGNLWVVEYFVNHPKLYDDYLVSANITPSWLAVCTILSTPAVLAAAWMGISENLKLRKPKVSVLRKMSEQASTWHKELD